MVKSKKFLFIANENVSVWHRFDMLVENIYLAVDREISTMYHMYKYIYFTFIIL